MPAPRTGGTSRLRPAVRQGHDHGLQRGRRGRRPPHARGRTLRPPGPPRRAHGWPPALRYRRSIAARARPSTTSPPRVLPLCTRRRLPDPWPHPRCRPVDPREHGGRPDGCPQPGPLLARGGTLRRRHCRGRERARSRFSPSGCRVGGRVSAVSDGTSSHGRLPRSGTELRSASHRRRSRSADMARQSNLRSVSGVAVTIPSREPAGDRRSPSDARAPPGASPVTVTRSRRVTSGAPISVPQRRVRSWRVTLVALVAMVPLAAAGGMASVLTTAPTLAVLIILFLPAVAAMANSEPDGRVGRIIWYAFGFKLVGLVARYAVIRSVYGSGDALAYHQAGALLARSYRSGAFGAIVPGSGESGTRSITMITATVYSVTGSSLLVGSLVFTLFGFTGLVLFVKAFRAACPDADHRRYAMLLL